MSFAFCFRLGYLQVRQNLTWLVFHPCLYRNDHITIFNSLTDQSQHSFIIFNWPFHVLWRHLAWGSETRQKMQSDECKGKVKSSFPIYKLWVIYILIKIVWVTTDKLHSRSLFVQTSRVLSPKVCFFRKKFRLSYKHKLVRVSEKKTATHLTDFARNVSVV